MRGLTGPTRLEPGEELAYTRAVSRHFYEDVADDDLQPWVEEVRDRDGFRAWVVRDGDAIVGNLGVFATTLSLPGGARVPVAAVTAVGVSQTYRRRGILRALMDASLREAADADEPVAALYASESAIYGRFGFGPSAPTRRYHLERAHVALREPVDPTLVETVSVDEAVQAFPPLLETLRSRRAGVGLSEARWRRHLRHDPPSGRGGASARRLVHVPGRGYATYRVKDTWDNSLPAGEVVVTSLVATDPEAEAALWQHVCDIDLTRTIEVPLRPPDDALPELLVDRLRARAVDDAPLYTCLLDVPTVLTARAYATDGVVTFTVHGAPATARGTYRLETGRDGAACVPTDAAADLELPADAFASVWLGGVRATQLAAARRLVEHRTGAAADLDRLLMVDQAPWTPFEF